MMKLRVLLFPTLQWDPVASPDLQGSFAVLFRENDFTDLADKVKALVLDPVVDFNFFGLGSRFTH